VVQGKNPSCPIPLNNGIPAVNAKIAAHRFQNERIKAPTIRTMTDAKSGPTDRIAAI
jgi:hypothetical protein